MKYHRVDGRAIARLREAAGLSQQELAGRCEITSAYMSMIENGVRQPSAPVTKRIALRLGVKLTDIAQPVEAAS